MSLREARSQALSYLLIGSMLLLSWWLSTRFTGALNDTFHGVSEHGETLLILCSIVVVFALGFVVYELAKPTPLPAFVLAIFFGIVCRDILALLTENPVSLTTLIVIGSVFILFEGGLDTPFVKFKKLLEPILSLAIIGTIMNAMLFSMALISLSKLFGLQIPLAANVLLGAAIASTDPAAIIPSFRSVMFKNPRVKYIAVSESAINDVVGAVLVGIFLTLLTDTPVYTVFGAYNSLLTSEHFLLILETIIVGTGVGAIGFLLLHAWSKWKAHVQTEEGTDAALFLAVPLFCYMLASALGGSGYLAVFLTGLLFHMRAHFRHVEHYFNHTIDGFMKPMIFMLLGALVPIEGLLDVADIGITAGLLFMFVLRPLIVLITLVPFSYGKHKLTLKELAFLSFVRETGVIPAALLITIKLANVPGADTIVAIGLWVILMTLIIEPPLTPLLACKLGLAKDASRQTKRKHNGPVAVLCSRGFSFPERMDTVVDWSLKHGVDNIALLHCPEERYSQEFVSDVKKRAEALFLGINKQQVQQGKRELNFEFICGQGMLQDNIETLIDSGDVSIIFVGCKMLDYRLDDVKRLNTPFFFMP